MHIPEQYNQIMPYLVIKDAIHFKHFMQNVFDATEQLTVPAENGMIMHGELKVGKGVIMYGEASEQFPVMNAGMFIYVKDADSTYKKALAAGAAAIPGQEPSDKDYGRTCGVTDPFKNIWWITSVIK
jgi:PhnB protein